MGARAFSRKPHCAELLTNPAFPASRPCLASMLAGCGLCKRKNTDIKFAMTFLVFTQKNTSGLSAADMGLRVGGAA